MINQDSLLKMFVIDLNSKLCHPSAKPQKEVAHEHRKNCLCTSNGSSALTRVPSLCRGVSGRLQDPAFLLVGSISLHGLCPTDVPRKFERHRGLPESAILQEIG